MIFFFPSSFHYFFISPKLSEQASTSTLEFDVLPERNAKISSLTRMIEKWISNKQKGGKYDTDKPRRSTTDNTESARTSKAVNATLVKEKSSKGVVYKIKGIVLDCVCERTNLDEFVM